MEIILLKDIEKLGDKHELVKVRSGYGRNFLIPQGVALLANEGNRKMLAELAVNDADWSDFDNDGIFEETRRCS